LGFPGESGIASHGDKFRGPGGMVFREIIVTTIGLIDGIESRDFAGDARDPGFDLGREIWCEGSCDGPRSRGVSCIGGHAITGSMDDRGALLACGLEEFVHAWSEFFESLHGVPGVMGVPDVADDDSRLFCIPGFGDVPGLGNRILLVGVSERAQCEVEFSGERGGGHEEECD